MTANGPLAGTTRNSDRDFLDNNIGSQHSSLYKKKGIFFLPFSFILLISSTCFILIFFCINSFFFFLELLFYEVSKASADGFFEILEMAEFTIKYLPVVVFVEILITTPGMIKRNRENKIIEEFYAGKNVVLEEPRWISKVGYVNRLHPEDLNKGERIEISPNHIGSEGVYFLKNMKCIGHQNMRGSETHTYYEREVGFELEREISYTTYYYYQIAYFDLNGTQLILKSKDYSPAFDTSKSYTILFKISEVLQTSNKIKGNILKLLVDGTLPECNPGEVGAVRPNLPQPMKENNSKAAVA